jgi:multiple sugar transport system permease protein
MSAYKQNGATEYDAGSGISSRAQTISKSRRRRTVGTPRKSVLLTVVMLGMVVYSLTPVAWLVINSTKTQASLFSTFGLWFSGPFALWDNIVATFTYSDGEFGRWLLNTILYVVVGGGGATVIATLGGYALAQFNFPGKRAVFAIIIGAIAIPGTALAVPTFLMFSAVGLTNSPWAVILPSLISPFGLYLIWIYATDAIPTELLEAARVDGAGELRIFVSIALRLLMPGFVTVLLFTFVATWNNYFLPLIMLSDSRWFPLTVGLNNWNARPPSAGGELITNLIVTGSLIAIVPTVVIFLLMQRYWESGLAAGSVKE